jgi:hypothetical protein
MLHSWAPLVQLEDDRMHVVELRVHGGNRRSQIREQLGLSFHLDAFAKFPGQIGGGGNKKQKNKKKWVVGLGSDTRLLRSHLIWPALEKVLKDLGVVQATTIW